MAKQEDLEKFYNKRSNAFTIVLNDSGADLLRNARYIYREIMCSEKDVVFVACILHDRDVDEILQHVKTKHYHIVITFNGVYRIKSIINWLIDLFHINENQITIDKCNSVCMQTRYLCHLDDFDKASYDISEVSCNDSDVLNRYYRLCIVRDLHDLIAVVKHYNYDLEVIMDNVAGYDKWRKYINDLIINYNRKGRY